MPKLIPFFVGLLIFACNPSRKSQQLPPWYNPIDYAYDEIKNPRLSMNDSFDKQGHRGCRGLMPENTIPAMLYALRTPVTTLEMDVVITKDKKVVLSHEPFFNHEITTKPDGKYVTEEEEKSLNIYQMTYEDVKKYDVGLKPHPRFPQQQKLKAVKPLLADVIDSVNNYMMMARRPFPYYNIETKCLPAGDGIFHPSPAEFVELLMAVIKEKDIEERVIIQSFDFRTLKYLHQKYPHIQTAALIEETDKRSLEAIIKELGFTPSVFSPAYRLVTDALVQKCHQRNIKIIPWTVNDKAKMDELKRMGVDGIISDYPDLFNE